MQIGKYGKWFYVLPGILIFVIDRITKLTIADSMPLYSRQPVIDDFFDLVHTRNPGIAFSLFADSTPIVREVVIPALSVIAILLVLVLFFQAETHSWRLQLGLAFVLAGALGNFYDRMVFGFVVDFLDFYIGDYHWPAFNIADSAITIGAMFLVVDSIALTRQKEISNDLSKH